MLYGLAVTLRLINIKFHFKSQSVSVLNLRHLDYNNFHYVPLSVQGKRHLPQVRDL